MSKAIAAAPPSTASAAQVAPPPTRHSRKKLIDAQRQSSRRAVTLSDNQIKQRHQKNACQLQEPSRTYPRYRPPLHTLIIAGVFIQIVALQNGSAGHAGATADPKLTFRLGPS